MKWMGLKSGDWWWDGLGETGESRGKPQKAEIAHHSRSPGDTEA